MIYINNEKYTVDGVDVYPDHKDKNQFWYVPGTIRLAERNGRKELSYMWYTESASDSDGTGFLNFEVNTAVPAKTLKKIKEVIATKKSLDVNKIKLAAVTYTEGEVNFSVLGPVAKSADDEELKKDATVLRVSKEQLVWSAGSSSLVGDNSAVCSVRFTKEGKFAAAMRESIRTGSNSIAAMYRLGFLAMRPAVEFKVEGTFEKAVSEFNASVGLNIPLEVLILDIGIQGAWERVMSNSDLKITVTNYTGEKSEGEMWAKKLLLDYFIKNFFEVEIGKNKPVPISAVPEVEKSVEKARGIEEAAIDKAKEDEESDEDGEIEENGEEGGSEEGGEESTVKQDPVIKQLVSAATTFIPKVNIQAAYYDGKQVNSIDFLYTEQKAATYYALPQSLVLEGLEDPTSYITEVNRSNIPFGQPYPIALSIPDEKTRKDAGIKTINIKGTYPADAPPNEQASHSYLVGEGDPQGTIPFPFQRDHGGSDKVEYAIDYIFKSGEDWNSNKFQYRKEGTVDSGLIPVILPQIAEFLTITVRLSGRFNWDEADQAVVKLTSKKWDGEKQVVINQGEEAERKIQLRCDADQVDAPVNYSVDLLSAGDVVHSYGPKAMAGKLITVNDRFVDHVPVTFVAKFDYDSADITVSYEDDDGFYWEKQLTLTKEDKKVTIYVPTLQEYRKKSDLEVTYEISPDEGDDIEGTVKGGRKVTIKNSPESA